MVEKTTKRKKEHQETTTITIFLKR